jgi:hypothetical protein
VNHAQGYAPIVRFPGGGEVLLLAGAARNKKDVRRRVWKFNTKREPVEVVEIVPVSVVSRAWPEPCREPLAPDEPYFYVDVVCRVTVIREEWCGDAEDMRLLERGLIHLTLEAAQAHAEALLSLCK